jgi:competence protein ComEA
MSAPRALLLALLVGGPAFASPPAQHTPGTGVLNLNTATQEQIDALPGVSPKLARDIVEHRKAHPFARAEEVVRVKGFGRNRFERLKPHLSVTGPTTFRPARAASRPRSPMTPLARSAER